MLKLKLQYFSHLMWRTDSSEKTLMLGKIEGGRRRGWQRMGWLDAITNSMDIVGVSSGSWWWTGRPLYCSPRGCKESDTTEWLNWTELKKCVGNLCSWHEVVYSYSCQITLGYLLNNPFIQLLWWLRWERICLQSRRPGFDPWVGKIPWRRASQPTPVFLPGESMDRGTWWATDHGVTKSWTWLKQQHSQS